MRDKSYWLLQNNMLNECGVEVADTIKMFYLIKRKQKKTLVFNNLVFKEESKRKQKK